jgi:hypothetical protein
MRHEKGSDMIYINSELGGIGEDVFMAYFKVLSGHLPTDLEETTRTIS